MYIFMLWQTLFNLFGSCDLDFRTLPTSVLGQTDSDKKIDHPKYRDIWGISQNFV